MIKLIFVKILFFTIFLSSAFCNPIVAKKKLNNDDLPLKNGVINKSVKFVGGELPAGSYIIMQGKDLRFATKIPINFRVDEFEIDKNFNAYFFPNFKFKCGILAKDAFVNGVKFAKGHFIEFDQTGEIVKQKNDFSIDVDKIFNEDGLRPIWDDSCFFREVESKKIILFIGIKWLPNTKMIFLRNDESIIMPRKFFARAGQQIEDQVLKHDSTILFCRRKKDDKIVIKSVTSSSFDDFVLNDDGGNQCPW
ncbi:MAG: hypothetical protein COW00_07175 [Bdellovibrio sp. CG12_big_fil_rev_8_21_14_0_65_39_13]|nr:MAG: hypothetical protein COW78_17040 [Bdellovibrio sp. CG22_combo_CG10-13_8_21_14_all_39_27]PIQ60270.1 MAG: hypothetical protein COW00_07175 [Bdellovibrio sp. CG12_big_fil_rev_8_21_14_0_65_39_13]PIR34705.1 MAG: hypothetical protein COV37_12285 [Bdellovibrio sp. CG11_big_fil_rev_8_21_14_0_20_39_38]PJB53466.1 MAG: hypothetical protein CO099_06985 [Bdellovibrio sp. CG_4_9_14_3_um_filter_39_7]